MTGDAACGSCSSCMTTGRAGSILAPGGPVAYATETYVDATSEMEPGRIRPTPDAEMVGPVLILDKPVEMATMPRSSRQLH